MMWWGIIGIASHLFWWWMMAGDDWDWAATIICLLTAPAAFIVGPVVFAVEGTLYLCFRKA